MLDPLLLRSFVAIIDTGSFTRAGERVHLTQSTISQQIRRLEQQLGCPLLDRAGRQVVATAEGEKLLGLARRILALLAQAEEQVTEGSVALSLGVPEDFAAGEAPLANGSKKAGVLITMSNDQNTSTIRGDNGISVSTSAATLFFI